MGSPAVAFVEASEHLDLVADFGVGRQIFGFEAAATEAFGGFAFGGEILGFRPADTSAWQLRMRSRDGAFHWPSSGCAGYW